MLEQGLAAYLGLLGVKETNKAGQAPAYSVSKQGTLTKVLPITDPEITGCFPLWESVSVP